MALPGISIAQSCLSVYNGDGFSPTGNHENPFNNSSAEQLADLAYPVLVGNYHSLFVGTQYILMGVDHVISKSSEHISKAVLPDSTSAATFDSGHQGGFSLIIADLTKEAEKRKNAWFRKSFEKSKKINTEIKKLIALEDSLPKTLELLVQQIQNTKDSIALTTNFIDDLDRNVTKSQNVMNLISHRMLVERVGQETHDRVRGGSFGFILQSLIQAHSHKEILLKHIRVQRTILLNFESQKQEIENHEHLFTRLFEDHPELKLIYLNRKQEKAAPPSDTSKTSHKKPLLHLQNSYMENAQRRFGKGKGVFVKIPSGNSVIGTNDDNVIAFIAKNFELMSTKTTQSQWVQVLKMVGVSTRFSTLNPSRNIGDQNPVENVSRADTLYWFEMLNKLSNKPDPTVQQELKKIFPGHTLGATYRLPTSAEWEYVVRNGSTSIEIYPPGIDTNHIVKFAVIDSERTQPVGSRLPTISFDQPFYDLIGNVQEWVSDWWSPRVDEGALGPKNGSFRYLYNPAGPAKGQYVVIRGANYSNQIAQVEVGTRFHGTDHASGLIGFRIARDIR